VVWDDTKRGSLRAGITLTLPFRDSYCATDPASVTESPLGSVTASKNWWDPYGGLDWLWAGLVPGSFLTAGARMDLYASAEIRWRTIYDYHKVAASDSEERQLSFNVILGIKKSGLGSMLGRTSPF